MFKSLSFLSAICIVAGLSVFHSCKEDVDPLFTADISDVDYLVTVEVVNSASKANLSGVTATITYPDKTQKTTTLSDGTLSIDMDNREDGELILQFDKKNFVSISDIITVDRSQVDEGSACVFLTTVMLTEINDSFKVIAGDEKTVSVSGSDATVKFPENCLTSDADISITETPSADELVEVGNKLNLIGGRIALKSFNFLPEGQTFEEAIEVTFSIPDTDKDLEFANFVDPDNDGNGVLESVSVVKNGDGTGTAKITHFSNWFLCTSDSWTLTNLSFSDPIEFTGDCDDDLVADFEISFDSDDTAAKDDLPFSFKYTLSASKIVDGTAGKEKTIACKYFILSFKNVSKGYTVQVPSFPVLWKASSEQTCHTGGSGN